jgi:hypothetical protein
VDRARGSLVVARQNRLAAGLDALSLTFYGFGRTRTGKNRPAPLEDDFGHMTIIHVSDKGGVNST